MYYSTVSKLETGRRQPSWAQAVALAKARGATPDDFLAEGGKAG